MIKAGTPGPWPATGGVGRLVILDGYNVIHRHPRLRQTLGQSLAQARQALAVRLAGWRANRRDIACLMIVFDGNPDAAPLGREADSAPGGVQLLYTGRGEKADERIVAIVREWSRRYRCSVITDDREVAGRAKALGAEILPVRDFFPDTQTKSRRGGNAEDPDLTDKPDPAACREIDAYMRRAFNI